MEFRTENDELIDIGNYERQEQLFTDKYVTSDCVVLELGARYGTVSCVINKKISNPANQVSVEPDEQVWAALEENMIKNNCEFHVVRGIISKTPMNLRRLGSATTCEKADRSSLEMYTLEEIEEKYSLKFNTLVADCEGFLETFFDENPKMYKELNLIIMEKDFASKCNYPKLEKELAANGFKQIESKYYGDWSKNYLNPTGVSCDVWRK